MSVLTAARIAFPSPEKMEAPEKSLRTKGYSRKFWLYVFGAALVGMGFVDFALLAYHFQKSGVLSPTWIPLFYALAMGVDGIAALWMGKLFDAKGIAVLTVVTVFAAFFAPFVLFGGFWVILAGMVLWGIGLGAQQSIMRSYVAVIIPARKRASAYGILYLGFGLFWFLGNSTIGFLYDTSLIGVVIFSIAAQLAGALFFLLSQRAKTNI